MTIAEDEVSLIKANVIRTRGQLMFLVREALTDALLTVTKEVEGGAWDGVPVVTAKDLAEKIEAVFAPPLPPPDDHAAEVATPAYIAVATSCPTCHIPQLVGVNLHAELITDDDGSELKVKAKAKGVAHVCGQLTLPTDADPDQVTVEQSLENLRVRMLGAVADAGDAWGNKEDPGPVPSLDVIARILDLPTENERADLEDSLYHLAGLEEPLLELVSYKKATKTAEAIPTHYIITEAGITYLAEARAHLLAAAGADGVDEAAEDSDFEPLPDDGERP